MEATTVNSGPVSKSSRMDCGQTFFGVAGSGISVDRRPSPCGVMKAVCSLLLLAAFTASGPIQAKDNDRLSLRHMAQDPRPSSEIGSADSRLLALDSELATGRYPSEIEAQPSLDPVAPPTLDISFWQNPEDQRLDDDRQQQGSEGMYFKFTDKLQFGDDESQEDQVPLGGSSEEPEMVPTIGFRHDIFAAEFNEDGFAAGMIQIGIQF